MKRQIAFSFAMAAFLSACSVTQDGAEFKYFKNCGDDQGQAAKNADWSKAEVVDVSFDEGMFEPALIEMFSGQPYVLRIENKEDFPSWFRAASFFSDVSINKIIYKNKVATGTCLEAIAMPSKSVAEVHLVPTTVDDYEFQDSPFHIPPLGELFWNSDTGYIIVR